MNLILWQNIPLEVYENHLNHPKLTISKALNGILKSQMKEYGPDSLTIWGIGGGAMLDQIKDYTDHVIVGVDINQRFLDVCSQRYKSLFSRLQLKQMDLDASTNKIYKTDFIWAPLIFNYLKNIHHSLKYASDSLEDNGVLSMVVLCDASTFNNDKLPLPVQVDVIQIEKLATRENLHLIESSLVTSTTGVNLQVLDFIKNKDSE